MNTSSVFKLDTFCLLVCFIGSNTSILFLLLQRLTMQIALICKCLLILHAKTNEPKFLLLLDVRF